MKLIYNGVDLATLGELNIYGLETQREGEAPQRERQVLRARLTFYETGFADNAQLIAQVRAALKTQQATLLWQDANGSTYVNRTVTAGADEEPADARPVAGSTGQAVQFTFWWYNHDLVTNCLNATWQRPGGPALDLGAVGQWAEGSRVDYFDKLKDPVRYAEGPVMAAGRWQADTTQSVAARRAALLDYKDGLLNDLAAGAKGQLTYGTFNQVVRITEFTAEVNQPLNSVEWKLAGRFTRYPNEADYALLEYTVTTTVTASEGITRLAVRGKAGAPTAAAAAARLATLLGALQPAGYVLEENAQSTATVVSESNGAGTGAFVEQTFDWTLRDLTTVALTWQREGAGTVAVSLGVVEGFADQYAAELFDPMRNQRKRASGRVSARGAWYVPDNVNRADGTAALQLEAQWRALTNSLANGVRGTLIYGTALNQAVRVTEFTPSPDRERNKIGWTLQAEYTRFPDEADYAVCEWSVDDHEDKATGMLTRRFAGKIGAPTLTYAQAKLARLRAALIDPTQWTAAATDQSQQLRETESGYNTTGTNTGDGQVFLELQFSEEWRKTAAGVLGWHLRVDSADDVKSGYQRVSYTGAVQVSGATAAACYALGTAQAAALGAGKYPVLISSRVVNNQELFQTSGGVVIMTVEFTYDYQVKGARVYLEVESTLTQESFGLDSETVHGVVAAPTLAAAQALYQSAVRSLPAYAGALIRSERTPTLAQETVQNADGTGAASEDLRFSFELVVARGKAGAGRTAVQAQLTSYTDIQQNQSLSNLSGTVWAADEGAARVAWAAYAAALNLPGVVLSQERRAAYEQGPNPAGGTTAAQWVRLECADRYEAVLGTAAAVLETSVGESWTYSGNRVVEKMLPDGPSVLQVCGTTSARHEITARALAPTEASARAYVAGVRGALLTTGMGGVEAPPRVSVAWRFQSQVAGVPRGGSANVRVCEVTGVFEEVLPVKPYTG